MLAASGWLSVGLGEFWKFMAMHLKLRLRTTPVLLDTNGSLK
jgi:hypothetical protein